MAGGTGGLHCTVVHFFCSEPAHCRAGMAKRTFVARHASRRGGRDMVGHFAWNAQISTGVARCASTLGNTDVGKCRCCPHALDVTDITTSSCRHMVGRLHVDIRVCIDMACCTCPRNNPCVRVRGKRCPADTCRVTDIARWCRRRDVDHRLGHCLHTIMTVDAGFRPHLQAGMGEAGRQPGRCLVTDIARLGGIDMFGRFRLGIRCQVATVVATIAVVDYN